MEAASSPARCGRTITQEMIDRYADVSGDLNPLHIDEAFASRTAFGRTIAHGQLLLSLVSEAMIIVCGDRWLDGGELDVRFTAPVFSGDAVTAHVDPADEGDGYAVELRARDRAVILGTARCGAA